MWKKIKNKWPQILFLFFTGGLITVVMLVCSLGTSPVYPHNYSYDSAFFRFIGAEILKGKTLYVDIWDHKGPILYLIQAVGALKGTTNKGINIIFGLQLLSLFISAFFVYKTNLEINGKKTSLRKVFALLVCVCSVLSLTIESGNLSEEWCLPITCCCFFLLMKYAEREKTSHGHPWQYAFIHGIGLGLITLIRANNAIPVCAGIIAVGFILLKQKLYKNLFLNFICGVLGIMCVWGPVFGWLYLRGALDDMIYAVFQFNMKYTGMRTFIRYTGEPFITRYLPLASAAVIFCIYLNRSRTFLLTDFILSAILATGIWMLTDTNVYLHYFTIFIPILFLVLVRCSEKMRALEAIILLILFGWFAYQNIQRLPALIDLHRQPPMFTAANNIPDEDRKSVIAVNMPPEIYLNYDLEPVSRFCAYQHVHFGVAPELKREFLETLSENPPLWILAFCSGETNIPEVQEFIDSHYVYRFDQSDVCYYQLKPYDQE